MSADTLKNSNDENMEYSDYATKFTTYLVAYPTRYHLSKYANDFFMKHSDNVLLSTPI